MRDMKKCVHVAGLPDVELLMQTELKNITKILKMFSILGSNLSGN